MEGRMNEYASRSKLEPSLAAPDEMNIQRILRSSQKHTKG